MLLNVEIDVAKASAPTNAPRGGAYTSREWTGTRWNYTYDDKPEGWQTRDTSEVGEDFQAWADNATKGIDPDKTFTAALAKATENPGTSVTVRSTSLDEDLTVTVAEVRGKQYLQLRDEDGQMVGNGSDKNGFKNKGQYDKWFIQSSNTHTRFDSSGNPWLVVVPRVGKVNTKTGELEPSASKNIGQTWKIAYHPSVPKDQQKKDRDRAELGHASTLELAKERIDGKVASVGESTTEFPKEPISRVREGDSGITQDIETGKFKWRYNEGTDKRELDVSAEEKQKMISAMSRDYWPKMQSVASEHIKDNKTFYGDSKSARDQWMERLIGDRVPAQDERDEHGKPHFVALAKDSPGYRAIEQAIDEWDPGKGVPLAGMIAGSNGKIANKIRNENDKLINEIKGTASGSVSSEEGTVQRADITADPASVRQTARESFDFDGWHSAAEDAVSQIGETQIKDPVEREQIKDAAKRALDQIASAPITDQQALSRQFSEALMAQFQKSLVENALSLAQHEDLAWKAMEFLTKDKNVDPNHQYVQTDGDENLPRFYYQDSMGNYVRYTNAPTGHPDQSNYYGDASLHPSEPMMESSPEYFTPDGQKMSRCPECDPADVEWNQQYNRYDPQNLWAARWRATSGDYNYSYIDADIRSMPKLQIHQQNALTDVRVPVLRQGYSDMFNGSDRIKDQMTALALALLDQGRFRAIELCTVCPMNVLIEGPLITVGTRRIYADHKIQSALSTLMQHKQPDEPLFTIPLQKQDGELEEGLYRRIGPHYLARVLDTQGISLIGLQTYHATVCFSREIQRALTYDASWESAKSHALLAVALEWGHDLRMEPDAMGVMQLIEQTLVDPIVVEMLQANAEQQGIIGRDTQPLPPAMPAIPNVSMDLVSLSEEEKEFSNWIHSFPVHERAEVPNE